MNLSPAGLDWTEWWRCLGSELQRRGYRRGSIIQYRQVLRALAAFCDVPPEQVTSGTLCIFQKRYRRGKASAQRAGMVLSVLRTLFDKLGGMNLTTGELMPRTGKHLPNLIEHDEVRAMINQADTLRDRVLIALLYGCGLKPSEACALKWKHIDLESETVQVEHA